MDPKDCKREEFDPAELIRLALAAREKAYAPYSGYQVGAALLVGSGRIFTGCNVENASFGGTICAERVAATSAIAAGEKEFVALAVASDGPNPAPPCGICRQFLAEFAPQLPLILTNLQGRVIRGNLEQYFPEAFQSRFMEEK